jgi:type I restriction enzyme S subunit
MDSYNTDLPRSWAILPLCEVAEINPKLDKADLADSLEVSFVSMPSVEAGTGAINVTQTRQFREVKKGYTSFREGDVLFAKITPCMENGKMAVVPALKNGLGFGSTEFHVLRPYDGINARYVYYFVSAQRFRDDAQRNMAGAVGQQRVPTVYLAEYVIPLPPCQEQTRIVSKIETLFSELDRGIDSLKTGREQLRVYQQALLNQASTGDLLVARGLAVKPFGEQFRVKIEDIVADLGQGWSPRCLNHPSGNVATWGVIKTTAIQHGTFAEGENKELPPQLEPKPHLSIVADDVLITRAGPRNRVGVACLVRKCRPRLLLCDKAYRLRVDKAKILPAYLEMLLNCPRVLADIERLKTGISDSGVNLTQDRFSRLSVLVPSLDMQRRTLDELEVISSQIDHMNQQIDSSLAIAVPLRQSILKMAFSGKLVAQNSSDEPASVSCDRNTNRKGVKEKGKWKMQRRDVA